MARLVGEPEKSSRRRPEAERADHSPISAITIELRRARALRETYARYTQGLEPNRTSAIPQLAHHD